MLDISARLLHFPSAMLKYLMLATLLALIGSRSHGQSACGDLFKSGSISTSSAQALYGHYRRVSRTIDGDISGQLKAITEVISSMDLDVLDPNASPSKLRLELDQARIRLANGESLLVPWSDLSKTWLAEVAKQNQAAGIARMRDSTAVTRERERLRRIITLQKELTAIALKRPVNLTDLATWLGALHTRFSVLGETAMVTMLTLAKSEVDFFLSNDYRAHQDSIAGFRSEIASIVERSLKRERVSLTRSMSLRRVPKYPDPGDDPYLSGLHVLKGFRNNKLLSGAVESPRYFAEVLTSVGSILRWVSRMPLTSDVQKMASDISTDIAEDMSGPKFEGLIASEDILQTVGLSADESLRGAVMAYQRSFEKKLSKMVQRMPEETFSGHKISHAERMVKAIEVLDSFLDYLENSSAASVGILELSFAGRIIFDPFIYVQEYLGKPETRQLVGDIENGFDRYLEQAEEAASDRETLLLPKAEVYLSLVELRGKLVGVVQMEDPSRVIIERKAVELGKSTSR